MITGFLTSVGLPIVADFLKSITGPLTRKFLGLSVEDEIKLRAADTERLQALSALDNPFGTPSQWVVDLRGSFRYVTSAGMVLGGLVLAGYAFLQKDAVLAVAGLEVAGFPFSFILGESFVLSNSAKR